MRKMYNHINELVDAVPFHLIWEGFHRIEFALYNDEYVYLADKVIPYDNRFLGNTCITYEGKKLAIWYLKNLNNVNEIELASDIVHEMFHGYQFEQGEVRFPNDIEGLDYPTVLENYQLKHYENILLVEALNNKSIEAKYEMLKKIIASRLYRIKKFGEQIKYEFEIETIEGCAVYCGTKSLSYLSKEHYDKQIEMYKKTMLLDNKILFDIRRGSYYSGTLFLLLLDEVGIQISKNLSNQERSIFEQVAATVETNHIDIFKPNFSSVIIGFEKEMNRKERLFTDFFAQNVMKHEGEFSICGYDPMNMVKVDNQILCSNFIVLENKDSQQQLFIKGPVMLELSKIDYISTYFQIV
ncbi:MAG: hypothetical protein ACRCST_06235 [Turicibacter sp.]